MAYLYPTAHLIIYFRMHSQRERAKAFRFWCIVTYKFVRVVLKRNVNFLVSFSFQLHLFRFLCSLHVQRQRKTRAWRASSRCNWTCDWRRNQRQASGLSCLRGADIFDALARNCHSYDEGLVVPWKSIITSLFWYSRRPLLLSSCSVSLGFLVVVQTKVIFVTKFRRLICTTVITCGIRQLKRCHN